MTNMPLIVALAQVEGSPVPGENLAVARQLVAEAAAEQADLICVSGNVHGAAREGSLSGRSGRTA